MTQTNSRLFDEVARLMSDAAGAANGIKKEIDSVVRGQAEKVLRDLDVVSREEFDAVKAMAQKARAENEALAERIAVLESKAGSTGRTRATATAKKAGRAKSSAAKTSKAKTRTRAARSSKAQTQTG